MRLLGVGVSTHLFMIVVHYSCINSRKHGVRTQSKFLIASDVDEERLFSGGATFAIMTSLFQSLTQTYGLTTHVAWRAAFAIVPCVFFLARIK